jgi:hypothetical protein
MVRFNAGVREDRPVLQKFRMTMLLHSWLYSCMPDIQRDIEPCHVITYCELPCALCQHVGYISV